MKIVHVTSFYRSGLGYQENCLLPAQARLGHDVVLITSDRDSPGPLYGPGGRDPRERLFEVGESHDNGVRIVRLPCAWEWEAHWWVALRGLWDAIAREKPDIIHAHNFFTVPTVQVLWGNRRRRYPLVVNDHNNYFNIMPYTLSKRISYGIYKHAFLPLVIGSLRRALPMSHEVQRYLVRELGVPERLMTLNFLAADTDRFRPDDALRAERRAALGLADDAVAVLSAGKFTRTKDIDVLIEAMADVIAAEPRAVLVLVGTAPRDHDAELRALLEKHRMTDRCVWLPFAKNTELPALYNAADIGVWPGDWSITVLEAAACGLPLVLPDKEFAQYSIMNDNGRAFSRGDAEALARELRALVADDGLRKQMGHNSRALTETKLNWDVIAQETIEIYKECALTGK